MQMERRKEVLNTAVPKQSEKSTQESVAAGELAGGIQIPEDPASQWLRPTRHHGKRTALACS